MNGYDMPKFDPSAELDCSFFLETESTDRTQMEENTLNEATESCSSEGKHRSTINHMINRALKLPDIVIDLNVGGIKFTTTRSTLTKYSDSHLANMFSDRARKLLPRDQDNRYFLDRNGEMFGFVLEFLRSDSFIMPRDFPADAVARLLTEARWYGIKPLVKCLREIRRSELRHVLLLQKSDSRPEHFDCVLGTNESINEFLCAYMKNCGHDVRLSATCGEITVDDEALPGHGELRRGASTSQLLHIGLDQAFKFGRKLTLRKERHQPIAQTSPVRRDNNERRISESCRGRADASVESSDDDEGEEYYSHSSGYGVLSACIQNPLSKDLVIDTLHDEGWIKVPFTSFQAADIYDKYMKISDYTFYKCSHF